jgi:RNA polymerase sigma-70 factor (ECF subfamily)
MIRHQDSVYHLAYRMTRSAAEAEDLAQEAFIRAYRTLCLYQPRYSFKNWVMTICANLARNRMRGAARRRQAEEEHLHREDGTGDRASEQRRGVVEAALSRLPESLRVPFVLRHVEGLSYEEIARVLSLGISAAKMRVARGRDAFAALIHGGGRP